MITLFPAKRILALLVAGGSMVLVNCSGTIPMPTGTPMPAVTDTASPTIVWFPSTDTPEFLPTQSAKPTEEYRPGLGNLIFTDSFDNPGLWNTSSSEQASATLTRNRLVLSVSEPGPLSILSLRTQPDVGDFYAEAMVDISLCDSKDQYGMVFRASSSADYYRFTINCLGQLRLERVRGGEVYPLNDWISSGDAPTGAPAQIKIGVWAAGRELRVFLNDHYQFSQPDPVFSNGTIGFYIYANGQTPVTVSFSDLSVYSVSYISPTPTAVTSPGPNPTSSPAPNP
jgi:hypothetical protein